MDFKRLRYFCALVENGSFSKAAKAVYMSQPPFSQRIRELEKNVGVELVHRAGKTFQITPAGWDFYHKAQVILSHVNGLINDFQKEAGKKASLIRIGVCPLSLAMFLNSIAELQTAFPTISYRIWVMDNQSLENALQEAQLDFAILQLPLVHANYRLLRLRSAPYVAVFGKNVPAPQKSSMEIEDLKDLPLLLSRRRDGGGGYEMLMRSFQYKGIEPVILADSQECRMLVDMLENGAYGVAIVPRDEVPATCTLALKPLSFLDFQTCPVLVSLNNGYLSREAYEAICFFFMKYREEGETRSALERLYNDDRKKCD